MMQDAIKNFSKQFSYKPKIENEQNLERLDRFIVVGMGGSHLAGDLLKIWNHRLPLVVHEDYDLPEFRESDLKESLVIISSYSGNTEEALDAFSKAREMNLALCAMSTGGKLLALAKEHNVPYIELPDTGIQPRSALGFTFKALLKFIGDEEALEEVGRLADSLDAVSYEDEGRSLAERLKDSIPIIYSSRQNRPIAYNWKIKFNETGKIPAFYNVFPELNHNEMTGFDIKDATKELSESFYFIFLSDETDHPKVKKRMDITKKLYEDRGFKVGIIPIEGKTIFHKIFSSLLIADWAAFYTATQYGLDPEQVPMVEEFKKLIA